MTDNNTHSIVRPLLVNYEVDIPEDRSSFRLAYDEQQMILMLNGRPAALEPSAYLSGGTRHTRVDRETTDDD